MRTDADSGPIVIAAETVTGELIQISLPEGASIVMPDSNIIITIETESENYAE